jgi:hypothetical protein
LARADIGSVFVRDTLTRGESVLTPRPLVGRKRHCLGRVAPNNRFAADCTSLVGGKKKSTPNGGNVIGYQID